MPRVLDLPERLINGPRGERFEVHRATIGIPDLQDISIGFAAYRDGTVVPSLTGKLIVNIGSSTLDYSCQLLGPATAVVIRNLPALSVIMLCFDGRDKIRGTSTVEHRNYMSRWCFF